MKIRIKGNSIRYRLSKTEVSTFLQQGYVEETVDFGTRKLIYALKMSTDVQISAGFDHSTITLFIPDEMASEWKADEKVGFNAVHGNLHLLIEKDFQCIDNALEDQSDNYPNPSSAC